MHRAAFVFCTGLLLLGTGRAAAADWHHPLYLSGGDYWRVRVRVTIDNATDRALEGRPVAVAIGTAEGEAALIGAAAKSVRVCDAHGTEMLFAIEGTDGRAIAHGPIPKGARLAIPVECPARASVDYFVYFNNPQAWQVPDFLRVHLGVVNGDVEIGRDDTPEGWRHDPGDPQHQATWSTERPQSGRRCLKTVVDPGAEPTWIATRQYGIQIEGGSRYRMQAWVRAQEVEGFAGWYIHVGNRDNSMLLAPMLDGGRGTYAWKQVTAEFTAPHEADRADLGTVLRGTGTAWFDNVTLECLEPGKVRVRAAGCERIELREVGDAAPWPHSAGDTPRCDWRAAVKIFNFAEEPAPSRLGVVDLAVLDARLRGRLDRAALRVEHGGKRVPHHVRGNTLLFQTRSSALSVHTYYVYLPEVVDGERTVATPRCSLATGVQNLVKNPGFEDGDDLPAHWPHNAPATEGGGIEVGLDDPHHPELGRRCARLHVPAEAPGGWWGWHQTVPVEPGKTYLLAAAVKCRDVRGGRVSIHAHIHAADGKLSSTSPMRSVGPPIGATTHWTRMAGLLTMPQDAATLRLHLTTNTSGTVWHDDVLLVEVAPGIQPRFEGRPVQPGEGVRVWPVNAVVKVFPQDRPPRDCLPARVSLARNEREPLQLAVYSAEVMQEVRVEANPPTDSQGRRLEAPQVNVVGYVPIDHPTSYYRSESPAWHRKYSTASGGSDGWPGLWPDPLLPQDRLDLEPNKTQAVWITFTAGKEAPAGEYSGRVRLVHRGKTVAEVPYRVRVWDFTLPDESHIAAIYDVRLGPGGKDLWGKSLDELYPEIIRFMAQRRLCPDTIRPAPVFRYENGEVTADFAEYDKAAAVYFDELKLPFAYTPWHFYLFGWGHPPKNIFGEQPYAGAPPYEGADRSKLRPEYKRAYQACLRAFWNHVKEKGWHKRIVLYISDEPFDRHEHIRQQMKALCDMIHEVDPEIPIYSSTWRHVPDWEGYVDVWGIGHDGRVSPETMARLRAAGDRLWLTTDGQMCTDTPYCAIERLLPHYCFKYGVEAYEFWGACWLTYDPYRFGWHRYIHQTSEPGRSYWVRYPNGDGFLIYPGPPIGHAGAVSSIRLEQAREGVEDFEYLTLLRARIGRAESNGRDVGEAAAAMQQAAQLIKIPNAGGRFSTKILPHPDAVIRLKGALGRSIERLGP